MKKLLAVAIAVFVLLIMPLNLSVFAASNTKNLGDYTVTSISITKLNWINAYYPYEDVESEAILIRIAKGEIEKFVKSLQNGNTIDVSMYDAACQEKIKIAAQEAGIEIEDLGNGVWIAADSTNNVSESSNNNFGIDAEGQMILTKIAKGEIERFVKSLQNGETIDVSKYDAACQEKIKIAAQEAGIEIEDLGNGVWIAADSTDNVSESSDNIFGIIVVIVLLIVVAGIVVAVVVFCKKNNKSTKYSPTYITPISKPTIYCRKCGEVLPLDSDFCHKCGTKVKAEE